MWQFTIRISTTTKYTLILPRSHSGSTANGETGEETESRSQQTNKKWGVVAVGYGGDRDGKTETKRNEVKP